MASIYDLKNNYHFFELALLFNRGINTELKVYLPLDFEVKAEVDLEPRTAAVAARMRSAIRRIDFIGGLKKDESPGLKLP